MFCGPRNTRKDAKFSEPQINSSLASGQETLVFQSRIMAEVNQQTQLATGCAEIIQDLRAVLIAQLRDRLDFENYFFVANEIRTEGLNQCAAAILQRLRWFRQKWNSLEFQLDLKALMINRLEKSAALISINGKARPEDRVAFVFVNQSVFSSFRVIGVFRGLKNFELLISWRPKHHTPRAQTNHQAVQIPLSDIFVDCRPSINSATQVNERSRRGGERRSRQRRKANLQSKTGVFL
jgi:hypothetical protein